ncbi:MAG: hypothetical protein EB060_06000 [Proteobacteria bacterium]|nr:hypothetical protein [Pseudomonadota bacterium]
MSKFLSTLALAVAIVSVSAGAQAANGHFQKGAADPAKKIAAECRKENKGNKAKIKECIEAKTKAAAPATEGAAH